MTRLYYRIGAFESNIRNLTKQLHLFFRTTIISFVTCDEEHHNHKWILTQV